MMVADHDGHTSVMDEVPRLVAQHWAERNFPIVMSMLGGRLSETAKAELRVTKVSLGKYISNHLSDLIRVVPVSETVDIVAPCNETSGLSNEELVALYRDKKSTRNIRTTTKFHPVIWEAFLSPIIERRFVKRVELSGFEIREEMGEPPEDFFEVLPSDLPAFSLETSRASWGDIRAAIKRWAGRVGLMLEEIEQIDRIVKVEPPDASQARTRSPLVGLIHALEQLTERERERVAIPADVLVSLLARSQF